MTKIIAFAGRKQSGKTTSAKITYDFYRQYLDDNNVKIYNFADLLKNDICINIFGLTYDQCYGSDDDKNSITDLEWDGKKLTAREVMQFVGTDIFRKLKENVWAEATIKKIQSDNPKIAIIADCRFPNEVKAVKDVEGVVIKLMLNPFESDHTSETALDPINYDQKNFDIVIYNNNLSLIQKNYAIMTFLKKKGLLKL